jgi:hypothetical protein
VAGIYCTALILAQLGDDKQVPDDLFYSLHVLRTELKGDLWIVLCAVSVLHSFSTANHPLRREPYNKDCIAAPLRRGMERPDIPAL